jgi:thioesterase domain-containing protein
MYGLFAYEAACQLEEEGHEATSVILLDTFLPVAVRDRCSIWKRFGAYGAGLWERASEKNFQTAWSHIAALAPLGWSFAGRIFGKAQSSGSGNPEIQDLSAILAAAERNYIPGPYRGRVTFIEAGTQLLGRAAGARFAWKDLCEGGIDIRTVPGDHYSIITPPYLDALAREISVCLEEQVPRRAVEEVNA